MENEFFEMRSLGKSLGSMSGHLRSQHALLRSAHVFKVITGAFQGQCTCLGSIYKNGGKFFPPAVAQRAYAQAKIVTSYNLVYAYFIIRIPETQ